ncbi:hypothetical protein D0Z07_9089 [Hyphodiscus hymeniophilus]|uniref:Uncharacterized protein n=1 Tax=Hyphodiscus hymeniophilus TaxID=353542 RepID=A0A9P6SL11_9HELO|nr:hypothetical protein D0Z07_9089 [Hyphodiscus hymeniophilus]
MVTNGTNGTDSEFLYHIKRTITDYSEDKYGATRTTDILGTFTDIAAAKSAARSSLASEGYVKDDFESYEGNDGAAEWKHGDGVLAYAKAPAGQVFEVRVETNPNTLHFKGNADGEVEGFLHYVFQQTIDYSKDPTGASQVTEVEGTYLTREAARKAARSALLDQDVTKQSFAEYDEFDDARDVNEWPYGENVYVHAVAETGENFNVSVKPQPHSHQHHAGKHHD